MTVLLHLLPSFNHVNSVSASDVHACMHAAASARHYLPISKGIRKLDLESFSPVSKLCDSIASVGM